MHRRLPLAVRKNDDDICESMNALFYAQPSWRDLFEMKMTVDPIHRSRATSRRRSCSSIRKMLAARGTYALIDNEAGGTNANLALSAQQIPRFGAPIPRVAGIPGRRRTVWPVWVAVAL